jgi:hypothetical protein
MVRFGVQATTSRRRNGSAPATRIVRARATSRRTSLLIFLAGCFSKGHASEQSESRQQNEPAVFRKGARDASGQPKSWAAPLVRSPRDAPRLGSTPGRDWAGAQPSRKIIDAQAFEETRQQSRSVARMRHRPIESHLPVTVRNSPGGLSAISDEPSRRKPPGFRT